MVMGKTEGKKWAGPSGIYSTENCGGPKGLSQAGKETGYVGKRQAALVPGFHVAQSW